MKQIRILHVVTYMGLGGLETMLMNYYRHIDRNKVQFDFLVHREFRADYDEEIESLGGRIFRLPKLVPWNLSYRKALNAFFRDHQEYKIVHVHQDCLSSIILKAARKNGVTVRIAHSHNNDQEKNLKYIIKLFYRCFIPRYATVLFACGKEAGNWMFRGASYQIVNNAINAEKFIYNAEIRNELRKELRFTDADLVFGHVGRFSEQKNHTFLLDIFAELYKKNSNSKLLLVGDGELKSKIESKVSMLGLNDNVVFVGKCSDVQNIYQAMDVFVLPSLFEGLGIVAIEAQAAGLKCFVSDGVSNGCEVTDLVTRLSLTDGAQKWADQMLHSIYTDNKRKNTYSKIVSSGYDIKENAKWLQNYYIEKWNEEV